jgi:hypothetical protein
MAAGAARAAFRSAWMVASVALALYALWIGIYLLSGHDARDFTVSSPKFVLRSDASPVIHYDPHYQYATHSPLGYDGQFCYYIALDPVNARFYVDVPGYRYGRILYPMLARLVALGQLSLVPFALVLVNWLAIGGGTAALALWLRRKRRSPWLALLYSFYPGLFFAVQRDLTEPLAYAFVALAVYLFDFGGRRRILWAGAAFALAGLSRETTLIFAVVYALALLLTARGMSATDGVRARLIAGWRPAALLLALSFAPLALLKLFLALWLGSTSVPSTVLPVLLPFQGLLAQGPWQGQQTLVVVGDVLPALLVAALGVVALARRQATVAVWALLANVALCVVLLNPTSYDVMAAGRVMSGVVLAALLSVPAFDAAIPRYRLWLCAAGILWLTLLPLWVVFPYVAPQ